MIYSPETSFHCCIVIYLHVLRDIFILQVGYDTFRLLKMCIRCKLDFFSIRNHLLALGKVWDDIYQFMVLSKLSIPSVSFQNRSIYTFMW